MANSGTDNQVSQQVEMPAEDKKSSAEGEKGVECVAGAGEDTEMETQPIPAETGNSETPIDTEDKGKETLAESEEGSKETDDVQIKPSPQVEMSTIEATEQSNAESAVAQVTDEVEPAEATQQGDDADDVLAPLLASEATGESSMEVSNCI